MPSCRCRCVRTHSTGRGNVTQVTSLGGGGSMRARHAHDGPDSSRVVDARWGIVGCCSSTSRAKIKIPSLRDGRSRRSGPYNAYLPMTSCLQASSCTSQTACCIPTAFVPRSGCVRAAWSGCWCGCDAVCVVMVELLWGRARGEHASIDRVGHGRCDRAGESIPGASIGRGRWVWRNGNRRRSSTCC